jgi:hypothetical protein
VNNSSTTVQVPWRAGMFTKAALISTEDNRGCHELCSHTALT